MLKKVTNHPESRLVNMIRAHRSMIARYFARVAPNRADVPDLVQEVFLKLSKAELPEPMENSGNYVMRVARSVLIDHHRRRQVRHAGDHVGLADLDIAGTDLPADRVIDSKAMAERLQHALLELPERTRDVFALRTIREMKMAEVARQMQISLSTAEKHHARALAHLARCLASFR